ncbi:MAG: hypothetical protein F6K24_08445, partial [Okeania sp. SIO2D1]|nr:hypothetical protein [Okeania sp. SIO2D1]
QAPINLPQNWISWVRCETNYFGSRNEISILQAIQKGVSQWIPWVAQLEPIKLKKNIQVYPGKKPANELEAAKRDHNPIRYQYQHQTGEQYIHIPGGKLTSVIYHSFLIIHKLLQTYINKQILTEQEVNQHLRIDNNRTIVISPELEFLLGKKMPQSSPDTREKIIRELNVY